MGEKGAKLTGIAGERAAGLLDDLAPLGEVTSKKMFGGYGVFHDGVMFALVASTGGAYLRASDETSIDFTEVGSSKHSRMPYYAIPEAVSSDTDQLIAWAQRAVDVAHAAKR